MHRCNETSSLASLQPPDSFCAPKAEKKSSPLAPAAALGHCSLCGSEVPDPLAMDSPPWLQEGRLRRPQRAISAAAPWSTLKISQRFQEMSIDFSMISL